LKLFITKVSHIIQTQDSAETHEFRCNCNTRNTEQYTVHTK